jgi:DNA-binding transcriptional MerR regulator
MLEIGVVARDLGVTPSTLRTWERRYRLVVPHRGVHGERLYDPDQLVQLRRVLCLVREGHRAGAAHRAAGSTEPFRSSRIELRPSSEAPLQARRSIDELLDGDRDERFAFFLKLVVGELVTNAVTHGSKHNPIRIESKLFENAAEIRVENTGRRLSIKKLRTRRRHAGRGLEIIDALADAITIDTGPAGTKITARIPRNPPTPRPVD